MVRTSMGRHVLARLLLICVALAPGSDIGAQPARDVAIRLDASQARGTLALLAVRKSGKTVTREAWDRVFETEAYRRLLARETDIDKLLGIDRGYSDASFLEWAESDEALEGLEARERTLASWMAVDANEAGRKAMKYLPAHVAMKATVYLIVRKQTNSFVWDLPHDPAIFLWVGPDLSAGEMAMTLAHELHHVGLSGACRRDDRETEGPVATARGWLSGFGEGLAVLAAAGGPDAPTHPAGQTELIASWDARQDSLETDMRRVEAFLTDVATGTVEGEEAQQRGMAFVNTATVPQGAFYTLGWFMGATIEREFGREAVIEATCDHGLLLTRYQQAARKASARGSAKRLPLWSEDVLALLRIGIEDR